MQLATLWLCSVSHKPVQPFVALRSLRLQGQADPPLNATGRHQAAELAGALRDQHVQRIVSSDLRRALQTAELVAAALGFGSDAIIALPGLRERHLGVLQARARACPPLTPGHPAAPTAACHTGCSAVAEARGVLGAIVKRRPGRRAQLRPGAQARRCSGAWGRETSSFTAGASPAGPHPRRSSGDGAVGLCGAGICRRRAARRRERGAAAAPQHRG